MLNAIMISSIFGIPIGAGVLCVRLVEGANTIRGGISQCPELRKAPYSPHIWPTPDIAFALAIFGLVWNVSFYPFMALCSWIGLPGVAFITSVLMQLVLACSFLVATIFQAMYMPHPLNRCQNIDRWEFSKEKPNLFQVLATVTWGAEIAMLGPQGVCNIFLKIWRIEVALTVLAFFMTVLGIAVAPDFISMDKVCERFALPFRFIFRYFEKHRQYRQTTLEEQARHGQSVTGHSNDVSLRELGNHT